MILWWFSWNDFDLKASYTDHKICHVCTETVHRKSQRYFVDKRPIAYCQFDTELNYGGSFEIYQNEFIQTIVHSVITAVMKTIACPTQVKERSGSFVQFGLSCKRFKQMRSYSWIQFGSNFNFWEIQFGSNLNFWEIQLVLKM